MSEVVRDRCLDGLRKLAAPHAAGRHSDGSNELECYATNTASTFGGFAHDTEGTVEVAAKSRRAGIPVAEESTGQSEELFGMKPPCGAALLAGI